MYLLDTNIISYSLYHPENYPHLMHKIRTVKQRDQYVSIVTVTELINGRLSGLVKRSNQKYPNRVQQYYYLEEMLKDVTRLQVLPFDEAAYREYDKIPASVRCGVNDKEIAGTALANNITLVTANVRHFEDIPHLVVEDWTVHPLE